LLSTAFAAQINSVMSMFYFSEFTKHIVVGFRPGG